MLVEKTSFAGWFYAVRAQSRAGDPPAIDSPSKPELLGGAQAPPFTGDLVPGNGAEVSTCSL